MDYRKLFNHLQDEHNLILLDSELQEIVIIVSSMISKCDKCDSNWGELRASCFECGHESEDLSR